ncbi:MAG TPA: class I SAM-dependent methyltransferase [Thermoplasmata archaeon]|nr:class I SAM-dependent methyltransferase [Thermoplasmata archaeon]
MPRRSDAVDWAGWLERWDRQQTGYMPYREHRFTTMLDVVAALQPSNLRVLDLACGPGSLSARLLTRFPRARAVALDFDPVLIELGRHALHRFRHRMRWVEADLRQPGWVRNLPAGRFDAVMTTTALHWLGARDLRRVYRQLHGIIRPSGVVLNGDHMAFNEAAPTFRRLARRLDHQRTAEGFADTRAEHWDEWWRRLEQERTLRGEFAERRRRFPCAHHAEENFPLGLHERALRSAGFREVGVIWQEVDNRILLAIR